MFEPDSFLRKRLQKRCTTSGVSWADVRWDPGIGALSIWTMDKSGEWAPTFPLLTESGEPRQIHNGDIEDCWSTSYVSGEMIAKLEKQDERMAEIRKREAQARRERAIDILKREVAFRTKKTFSGGKQIGGERDGASDFRACPHGPDMQRCAACNEDRLPQRYYMSGKSGSASNGFVVVDRRRFRE